MPSPRVIGLIAVLAGFALPATAQAAPSAHVSVPRMTLKPGATAQITVHVESVPSCTLRVRRRTATVAADGAVAVSFRFRVAPRTSVRRARATVTCEAAAAQTVALRIVPRIRSRARRTARLIAGPIRAAASRGAAPAPAHGTPPIAGGATPEEASALAEAQAQWTASASEHRELWRTGECTDWADRKRPDVVERVTVAKWAAELLGRPAPKVNWNGGFWDETAAAYGLPVGSTPKAGALVTWDPGVMGAGDVTGHIGYVESVGPDAFVVSEMHAPERGVVAERRIALDAVPQRGIAFIY